MTFKKQSIILIILGFLCSMELQAMEKPLFEEKALTGNLTPKKAPLLSEEVDQKVVEHLKSFGLSAQKVDLIWSEFGKILTAKLQIHPFSLASFDPYFISCG